MPLAEPIPVFPEATPVVNGRNIEMSVYLAEPGNIVRDFTQLYTAYSSVGRLLPDSGRLPTGVGRFYPNDPEANAGIEEVEEISPGSELPEYGGRAAKPKFIESRAWGHKIIIPRQSIKKNDWRLYDQLMRGAVHSLERRFKRTALETVKARINEDNRFVVAADDWEDFTVEGAAPTGVKNRPEAAIDLALAVFEDDDQGQVPNLAYFSPTDWLLFKQGYGGVKRAKEVLAAYDLEPVVEKGWASGSVLLAVEGQLGGQYWAEDLTVDPWENKNIRSNQIDMEGEPAYVVDNTPAAVEIRAVSS